MRTYYNFVGLLYGNEFVIQLLLISLAVLPFWRRRKFFFAVFPLSYLLIFGVSALFSLPLPYYYLIIYVFLFSAIFASFKVDFAECLFYSLTTYCAQHILSTACYSLSWIVLRYAGFYAYRVFYPVASCVFLLGFGAGLYFFYTQRLNKQPKLKFNHVIIVYAATVFIGVAVFLSYFADAKTNMGDVMFCFIKLFSLLHGIAVFVINMLNVRTTNLEEEKLILQILLDKDKEYYERARLNAEKINIKYHDLKYKVSRGIPDEEIKNIGVDFFTGNRALDIILTEKLMKCEKCGIRFVCSAQGELLGFLKPYHIYSLFGNAFDNAIESLVDVPEAEKREIVLNVSRFKNMCRILISNYFEGELAIENGLPKTKKADSENHGYGIKSIRDVSRIYNGEMQISVENNQFNLLVILPLPCESGEKEE